MKMAKTVPNTSATLQSGPRPMKVDLGDVAWFSLFVLLGSLAILRPFVLLVCLAVAAALGFCWLIVKGLQRAHLELWQALVIVALTGYMLLSYGFENLAFHVGGVPIIISYGLMYGALALAVFRYRHLMPRALHEPAILCMLGLFALALLHLAVDVPSYGIWAVRDATMCLDGVFMLLGLLWAMKANSTVFLTKWLMVVFVLNMFYSFTQPWGEKLWSWSPKSGIFLSVPIIGNFNGRGDVLMAGAVFCICVGSYVIKRPSWLMLFLAGAQFLGIAIAQTRRMYIGAVVVLIILVFLGEAKKFAKLLILLPASVIVILLVTTVGGLEINGRVGTINLDFFKDHIRSIHDSAGTPGSSVESRFDMVDEALGHFRQHPVFGVGFGQPLLTEMDHNNAEGNNAVTRMPHNSSVSYLARLGIIGFALWIAFHLSLIKRFISALRQRGRCDDKRLSAFVLWFFLFYVLFMIGSLVEGPFEFPSGAVPFYFLMGFALGLIRWQLPDKTGANGRRVHSEA
jgi:O-antigen ligase